MKSLEMTQNVAQIFPKLWTHTWFKKVIRVLMCHVDKNVLIQDATDGNVVRSAENKIHAGTN